MVAGSGGGGASGGRCSAPAAMWRCVCMLALLCAALLRCNALKRAEMSPVPFVLSSRYGRSSSRAMMPRSDRFFLGTRYGKRSDVGVAGVADAAGGGSAAWRGACDCEQYARRLQNSYLYKRRMGAPEQVPTED